MKKKVAPPDGIMMSMPTGFCSNGFCEGRKVTVKIPEGTPTPRCKGRYTSKYGVHKVTYCPCDCHDEVGELYKMVDRERVWPTSLYQSPKDEHLARLERERYVLTVTTEPVIVLPENATAKAETVTIEEAIAGGGVADNSVKPKLLIPPNPKVPTQERVTRGRPPGQLELEVKIACDSLILGIAPSGEKELRPVTISRMIDPDNPPSTGAVTNILRMWARIGFATIEEGPVRFLGYTNAGIELGIEPLRKRFSQLDANQRRTKVLNQREHNRSGGLVAAVERRRAKKGR